MTGGAGQAGAKHVYGVECSGIIHSARQVPLSAAIPGGSVPAVVPPPVGP